MKSEIKSSILVYVLILVNIALVMSIIVLNNYNLLLNNNRVIDNDSFLTQNIATKVSFSADFGKMANSDGSGLIDNISCPSSVAMSGATISQNITTSLTKVGDEVLCHGLYNSQDVNIYFNNTYTSFDRAFMSGYNSTLNIEMDKYGTFSDPDNTSINFLYHSYSSGDSVDDDFNDDDYKSYSGVVFSFEDNDNIARKTIYNYGLEDSIKNIFWDNWKIEKYIYDNVNNNDSFNLKLGDIINGHLYLNIDKGINLKIVEFDKDLFDESYELRASNTYESDIISGSGYIQYNMGILSLNPNLTGNEFSFNFKDKDYGIFIKNLNDNFVYYTLTGYDTSGKTIYINPIDDVKPGITKILGYDIIIDDEGHYIQKMLEVINSK